MSVSLRCPNCGAEVGIADSNDNYQEKYFYKGKDNQPICGNCNASDYSPLYSIKVALVIISILIASVSIIYGITELVKYLR